MLRELHVKNLAVLAAAAVEFGPGLNILSGETGAGKSIVVDSLALLAGVRATTDLIRTGADTLTVSGVFAVPGSALQGMLEEAGIEMEGDEVLVRREIARSGRNRVFVNDQPATLRLLAELAPALLRIHGQREELGLVDPELQRVWLDKSGGAEAERLAAEVAAAWAEHGRLAARLELLAGGERLRHERLDLLRFQVGEIDEARLVAGEETALYAERGVLRHADAIARALGTAFALLSEEEGAAVDRLARSRTLLAEVEAWEPQAAEWGSEIEELRIRAAEVAQALARRVEGLPADPARLDAVEERLAVVERLCRKYARSTPTPSEVLARRAEMAAELAELEGDGDDRGELEVRVGEALARYRTAALALSVRRAAWGEALVARIGAELKDLGLGKARLAVALERRHRADSPLTLAGEEDGPIDFGPTGIDQVVFLFTPNPGEAPRPLARIASGGELSRIYLALQLAARGEGQLDTAATLVFDEVDAGIGGAEAAALGKKLQRLARGGQILAVTHLPQVASHADLHFKVSKRVREGRTQVEVQELAAEERVTEVARMLAGKEVTALSRSHAEELIAGAARSRRDNRR
ncbi:MAG TPA: DNA repair protein RecN [Thermoanaerobaculia bacterium]|nr:DNA repair protein RecN [Thermoanaerobaculia bacterium]